MKFRGYMNAKRKAGLRRDERIGREKKSEEKQRLNLNNRE